MSHLHSLCIQEIKMDCLEIAQWLSYRRPTDSAKTSGTDVSYPQRKFLKLRVHREGKYCLKTVCVEWSLMYPLFMPCL